MAIRRALAGAAVFGAICGAALVWRGRHRLRDVVERTAHSTPSSPNAGSPAPVALGTPTPMSNVVAEVIFEQGHKPAWQDWGWAPHDDVAGGPARVDMSNWGGWQLVHQGLSGHFGGVRFRYRAPIEYGDFLTLHLEQNGDKNFPVVPVDASRRKPLPDGWSEVSISMGECNPDDRAFDRVVFFVSKSVPKGWTSFDDVVLLGSPDPSTLPAAPTREVTMTVDTGGKAIPIHPGIYGVAFLLENEEWTLGMTGRRWGGNSLSRYNWTLGNATNLGRDWYFENVAYGMQYPRFLTENVEHHVSSALTLPMIGWVSKDTTSVGFPKSSIPQQDSFDPYRAEAGNGIRGGKEVTPGAPNGTSTPAPPDFIRKWVEAIRKLDQGRGSRSVQEYILDNEPNLWNATHRDIHPDPLTYDELVQRTIEYGTQVRAADKDAIIAGPAEWGWTGYFYSAKDSAGNVSLRPDRRAHGDVPLMAYYLAKLREHEQKTGTRILDVFDLHFYPQGKDVYSPQGGKALDALRIRSTRALWDPTYVDESWINEPVKLIPRMKQWVAENYPGVGIQIGEWNFGGEGRMSGGLATAEALGRFGQQDVTSAFYWTHPPAGSPSYWAFRTYRNFDGRGGRFQDFSLGTTSSAGTSLFASRDERGTHFVLVALNLLPDSAAHARIDAPACNHSAKREVYQYVGTPLGFSPPKVLPSDGPIIVDLPPSSITVVDIHLAS